MENGTLTNTFSPSDVTVSLKVACSICPLVRDAIGLLVGVGACVLSEGREGAGGTGGVGGIGGVCDVDDAGDASDAGDAGGVCSVGVAGDAGGADASPKFSPLPSCLLK